MPLDYDPTSMRWADDPYPVYARLREEAPVHRGPESGVYAISRYEDVHRVLNDPETFSSRAMFTVLMSGGSESPPFTWQALKSLVRFAWSTRSSPFAFAKARNLIASDGATHSGMRKIVNRGFTPRRIQSLEPRIDAIVEGCLAGLRRGEPFDVVRDLAIPLPVTMIAEMLGIASEHHDAFKRWSDTVIYYSSGPGRGDPFGEEFTSVLIEFMTFLREILQERRANPADDLISTILAHQDGENGLSDLEAMLFVQLLQIAGNETTTNLIGNAVAALLDHPDELERFADDPARVPAILEETLRFDAPVQLVFRTVTRPTEIAGVPLAKGDFVAPLIGSANRDERHFANADRFDPDRGEAGHLGFGFGAHFCLGASLARLEARAALQALAPHLRGRREVGPRSRVDSFLVRGHERLELAPAA